MSVFDDPNNVAALGWNGLVGGEIVDLLGNGNNVTLVGAVVDTVIKKVNDGSVLWDGIDDYGTMANESNLDIDHDTPFGFNLWVYPRANVSKFFFAKWDGSNIGYSFSYLLGGKIRFSLRGAGGKAITVDSIDTFPINNWANIGIGYNGNGLASGMKFFLAGVRRGLSTTGDNLAGTSTLNSVPLLFGARTTTFGWLNTNIDATLIRISSQFTDGGVAIGVTAGGEVAELWNGGAGLEPSPGGVGIVDSNGLTDSRRILGAPPEDKGLIIRSNDRRLIGETTPGVGLIRGANKKIN